MDQLQSFVHHVFFRYFPAERAKADVASARHYIRDNSQTRLSHSGLLGHPTGNLGCSHLSTKPQVAMHPSRASKQATRLKAERRRANRCGPNQHGAMYLPWAQQMAKLPFLDGSYQISHQRWRTVCRCFDAGWLAMSCKFMPPVHRPVICRMVPFRHAACFWDVPEGYLRTLSVSPNGTLDTCQAANTVAWDWPAHLMEPTSSPGRGP